ncbi:MAG TPA: type II toxin-antitoxin system RelE/ParE family toxin [Bacteroidales bacterium]|nr:type II toxin-antitoxin system RelE/ParE family toxin [Bacteroidales bacterium]
MKINFFETPIFNRLAKRLGKKYKSFQIDFDNFLNSISQQTPNNLGNNVFKYRFAIKSKNKGKSGGLRIITFEVIVNSDEKNITLLTIYDKSEQDSISKKEINEILNEISKK